MADFVLLYSGGSMPETDEERAAVMQAWNSWMGALGASLKDGGNPFAPAVKTIANDGSVRDGAPGPLFTGYSIVSADSLDAAVDLAKGSPVLSGGGNVTVYETFDVM